MKFKNYLYNCHLGLARIFHRPSIPIGAVLMLHRVDVPKKDGIWFNQHLKMSPSVIEEMVVYACKHGCRFVSLSELTEAIQKKKNVRRWIAITLDDGYQDNYTNGTPVFRKLGVPYTIYVCTRMVKGEMLYWWEILENLVLAHNSITLHDGRCYDCSTKDAKERSFLEIREVIMKLPQESLLSHLKELFVDYDIDYGYGNDKLGLSWEEITQLIKDPLCTIGNHTYSHSAFTGLTDEEIKKDINYAASEMKNNVGIDMHHFAFPFGEATAVSKHDVELVKHLGFKTSATTNDGLICYGTNLLELPRLFVTEKNWKHVIDRVITNC